MRTHQSALLLGLAAILGLGACSSDQALGPAETGVDAIASQTRIASEPAPDRSTARYEIDFMQDMIDHHAMAVMMAEMCVEKAVHEELRRLCEDIIAAQSAEIQQMQGWLQEWYGISYAPEMTPGAMKQMEKLAALSGAEFEIAFMEMMIKHHAKAVKEGERCVERVYHEELRELCENIIATQTAEIVLMESWLCEWYGNCK
ncbi:MAG TPA: DUF305 domain-containing protein [Dehalococcoidia bacterium]|jgi:uncharacterized protein (DUF305 family)|nr:DUF305 domain-containing protein [Dehalococcoidia bacterium]